MDTWMMMLLTGLLYLFVGVPAGMALRFSQWANKQKIEDRSPGKWWWDRLGSNVTSIVLGILGAGVCINGALLKWTHLEGSGMGLALAAPFGAAITWGAHYIMAYWKRKAEEKTGPIDPSED